MDAQKESKGDQSNREAESIDRDVRTVPADVDHYETFPEAIAVRIGERDLWIANGGAVQPANLEKLGISPDYIVSLNGSSTDATTDHHPLKDGYVNIYDPFVTAIDTTRKRIREDGTVIVNCAAGVSRSSTVLATAMAVEEGIKLSEAIETVKQHRQRARPHPKLLFLAYAYLVTADGRSEALSMVETLAEDISTNMIEQRRVEAVLTACRTH